MTLSPTPRGPGLDDTQRRDWLRLLRSENVGPVSFRALVNRYGGAAAALEALPELSARGGLRRAIRICSVAEADDELDRASRIGCRLVAAGEPDYPPALDHVDGGPPLLYVAGRSSVLSAPMIAIVGSRNCSAAGIRLVRTIAEELASSGITIVSGLARGIDAAAHRASLATGTVAVLAGGHDRIYPAEHHDLAQAICETGALVSEMPPGWEPRARDFPRRNRIISGVSLGVVVAEAATRSGTLITARFAGEQGREVFAIPGSPLDPRAEGTNRLIREGATLTRGAQDVLEGIRDILGREAPPHEPIREPPTRSRHDEPDEDARRQLVDLLSVTPVGLDELARQSGLAQGSIMLVLVELELAGRLERHAGQRVSLSG